MDFGVIGQRQKKAIEIKRRNVQQQLSSRSRIEHPRSAGKAAGEATDGRRAAARSTRKRRPVDVVGWLVRLDGAVAWGRGREVF